MPIKKGKDKKKDKNKNKDSESGCFDSIEAKSFEIILIIGFFLGVAALVVNLVLTLWCFKHSLFLFITEIGLGGLNVVNIILAIILRIWRNDGSVFKSNLSSSKTITIISLVILIINFLGSAGEDVLFYFLTSYLNLFKDINFNELRRVQQEPDPDSEGDPDDDYEFSEEIYYELILSFMLYYRIDDSKKEQKRKNFHKIMKKKLTEEQEYNIIIKFIEKKKLFSLLPWITINFNALIQILMGIVIFILMNRINIKSDFGFPQSKKDKSSKNKMLYNPDSMISGDEDIYNKKHRKRNSKLKTSKEDMNSEQIKIGKKKHKKRRSKKN
jgi:hypothetical protein